MTTLCCLTSVSQFLMENNTMDATNINNTGLPSDYQRYMAMSRYARYLPDEKRRESWEETIKRYCDFWQGKYQDLFPYDKIQSSIYNLEVMPSMRALMTAGKALSRDEAAGYNCAYLAVDDPRAFDECLYLLMAGCGVGFSVERQVIAKLPIVSEEFYQTDSVIKVKDSKIGWASAFRELIAMLFAGQVPQWDLSLLRPMGAPLKTFGGRSSGPEPLNELFENTVRIFSLAKGRKLTSLECHDIMNFIGSAVVVGGVRRCLPGDTLVQIGPTEWKEIKDFVVGDMIYLEGEYQQVKNIFDQGNQEVLKIILDDGSYLESTANHKWLVFNKETEILEWIETQNLKECHGMIDPN